MKSISSLIAVLLLSGCSFAPKSMDDLKTARFQQDRFVLQKDYQSLAKCWEEKADKPNDILGTKYLTTTTHIDAERGLARMQTGGEKYGLYHLVLELQQKSAHETYVEIFANKGSAPVGEKWVKVLKACAEG